LTMPGAFDQDYAGKDYGIGPAVPK
jgi:hypothetical protein